MLRALHAVEHCSDPRERSWLPPFYSLRRLPTPDSEIPIATD
jgi:hypothetical protein